MPRFDFLETQTLYATEGLALCRHKRIECETGAPFYRIPRMTAGTDRTAVVRMLANTWMRVIDNCTLECDAVVEIQVLCARVRALGYSGAVIVDSWKILSSHLRYAAFGRRWQCVRRELNDA